MSKISELSNGGALLSTDDLIVVRSGGNVRAQMSALNGVVIGASTPAAGSFTTGSFSGNVSFSGNLVIGKDAATSSVAKTFTTADASANRGKNQQYGMNDAGFAGMEVVNAAAHNTNFNAQSINFITHEGAVSIGTRMTITSRGLIQIGNAGGATSPTIQSLIDPDTGIFWGGANILGFSSGGSEAMRISGGDLLVGTTNTLPANNNVQGIALSSGSYGGRLEASRSGGAPVAFNRTDTGSLIELKTAGTTIGLIGSASSDLYLGTGDTTLRFADGSDAILPTGTGSATRDGAIQLGHPSHRFSDIFLSGGVYLGGTGSANHLSDYEEGAWTPALANAGSPSYSTQYGRYTKIGRVVYCSIAVRATSVSGSSNIEISGLPFTPADASDALQRSTYAPRNGGHCSGLSEASGRFRILTSTNMAGVKGDTSTSFMTAAQFSSGGSPQFTGDFWYYTS